MSNATKIWYQVYPQSQPRGRNNDSPPGHGNFSGIVEHTVPYAASLGVQLIYFGPFFKSHPASSDQYYEVVSHRDVDPRFGTIGEFKAIIDECHKRGIQVMIDFPICTLSVESEQFKASADPGHPQHEKYKDWFIWKNLREDGEPINNWKGFTRGTVWRSDEKRGQTYLAWFYPTQANLNLRHQPVQEYIMGCLEYWLNGIGVDGVRLDAIARLFNHDVSAGSPHNYDALPGTTEDDLPWDRYDNSTVAHLPETFAFVGELQRMFPDKILMPEIAAGGNDFIAGAECLKHGAKQVYTAEFFESPDFRAGTLQQLAENISAYFADSHVSCPGGHDNMRLVERTAPPNADPVAYTQYVLATTLALSGRTLVYQGYELALPDSQSWLQAQAEVGKFPIDQLDPLKRDGARTPFPYLADWDPTGWEGYLPPDARHLPLSVEKQECDPYSCLHQTRHLFAEFGGAAAQVMVSSHFIPMKQPRADVLVWMREISPDEKLLYVANATSDHTPVTLGLNSLGLDPADLEAMTARYTNGGIDIQTESITLEPYAYAYFSIDQNVQSQFQTMHCSAILNDR